MRALKISLFLLLGIGTIILLILFLVGYFKPPKAGILVDANRSSLVFIDGQQVGRTRYEGTYAAGEASIKLVPESFEKPIPAYEVKVDLTPGVRTIVQRDFGETEELSGGAIISFERTVVGEVGVAIVSTPDTAQVAVDGQVRGFTPFKTETVSEDEHTITISLSGYSEKTLKVRTYKGYKLIAAFKLVPEKLGGVATASPSPSPTPETEEKKFGVEILDTPTGFLRVRKEPSSIAEEVGQVSPLGIYWFLEQDLVTGWFKIEYAEGQQGWISSQYSKKVSQTPSPKPSPSPSASPSTTPSVKPTPFSG